MLRRVLRYFFPDRRPGDPKVPESESQFRRLLEMLPAAAYTCDGTGLITYFNERAVQLWGRAPKLNDPVDRFCGSFKLFAADGSPILHEKCWMALALRNNRSYNGQEIMIERPDGSRLTALAHANPLSDSEGKIVGAFNVLIDISEHQDAEVAERMLASIVESSDDAIISKTLEGRIVSWNKGAERVFGYTASEAVGRPVTLLIPPNLHHEEWAILDRLRRGERIDHYETVRITKEGRLIDISLTVSPMRDRTGRIVGASKIARDISSRKHSERMLSSLSQELASQVDDLRRLHEMSIRLAASRDLQPILDETLRTAAAIEGTDLGILLLCNEETGRLEMAASHGFDAETATRIKAIAAEEAASVTCFREGRRVVIEDVQLDLRFATQGSLAAGPEIPAVHSTPLITRLGKVIGALSMYFRSPHRPTGREADLVSLCARQAVDFIENVQLCAQLREADCRKDEFLATLAHELRNPLAPLSNSLHVLRMSDELTPTIERTRDIMERQVNHLVRLVDDLLEVSRITQGKIELRKERVDLAAVVGSAVESSRPSIESAGHQLAITLPREPVFVEGDPLRLAQVVGNLLNNAAKYTDVGGQIWLTVRRECAEAIIAVRDNGFGIAAEMLPRVFDLFAQVDRTLSRAQGGLGIGLNLARNFVKLHRGRIEARSEGPGKGSEFLIYLPMADSASTTQPAPVAERERRPLPRRRILVVDDLRAAAYTLAMLLEKMEQDVQISLDARSALELARANPPDLIISDVAMPGMDGYDFAYHVRQTPELKRVVLVALTGYGQESDRQKGSAAGFDQYLVKPISVDALQELLASLAADEPALLQ